MYVPNNVPNSTTDLPSYLAREFQYIAREWIQAEDSAFLNTLYAEPDRPREGMIVKADGTSWNPSGGAGLYVFINGVWYGPLARFEDIRVIESQTIACSDETTAITTGTAKRTWRAPYALTLQSVRASCNTAPTGAHIIIDINEGTTPVSILSTKLRIDTSTKTSVGSGSAAVISDTAIADDAELTIDFDQVGSTVAGTGVKVTLVWQRAV
jgi:hypothetical protein